MPAKTPAEPDPVPLERPTPEPEAAPAEPPQALPGRQPAGTYAYTGTADAVYLEIPLTARPAGPNQAATVFHWPFGAPDDGRWAATRSKPNQVPDNESAPASSEE